MRLYRFHRGTLEGPYPIFAQYTERSQGALRDTYMRFIPDIQFL